MSMSLDAPRDVAAIHPIQFWHEIGEDGTTSEWVKWVKKGSRESFNPGTTSEKIARLQRDPVLWDAIRPYYEAWKRNEEAPVNGTPLDAAPFVTKELCAVLRRAHILSIEDLASAEDAALMRFNIPGLRAVQQKARAFLDAQQNLAGVTSELAQLRQMVEQLRAEKDEAVKAADQMASETGRRRRTREEVMQGDGAQA